ncbi:fibronectin type III domain-containing protein 9 [Bombina bombina]|uniref:fibronectin type III domain-containing protein 9 n=1 Tax=Bombina bombina TaxID=8345 RepID=UPI00235ACE42|nr:fibronectin type III domain-containing protein 9 [Bombina bombina]
MGISVQNITANTAMVIWPSISSCSDSFYSIMYQSNWNTMLSGYSKKNFQKEERIPGSRTFFTVENLTPLTTYILCVTCQSANPTSDQCRIFHTLGQDPSSVNSKKKDLALGIWLTSSILLLIITCILLYGCLHIWWRKRQERAGRQNGGGNEQDKREAWTKNEDTPLEEYEASNQLVLSEETKIDECLNSNQLDSVIKDPVATDEDNRRNFINHELVSVHPTAVK